MRPVAVVKVELLGLLAHGLGVLDGGGASVHPDDELGPPRLLAGVVGRGLRVKPAWLSLFWTFPTSYPNPRANGTPV